MKRSAIRDLCASERDSRITQALHPGYETTIFCVARRAKHASGRSTRAAKNIPLYRISESAYVSRNLAQRRGAYRDRHETRAGRRWALMIPARRALAGRETVSRAVAHTTGVIGVRQNRVVLAPAVWRQ